MRGKSIIVGAAAVFALIAGTSVAVATSTSSNITRAETLRFNGQQTSFALADVNRNHRPDPAETFALVDTLREGGTSVVGQIFVSCTVVTTKKLECTFTLDLRDGKISGNGDVPFPTLPGDPFIVPVTGGSGRYLNVGGFAQTTLGRNGASTLVVHLLP